MILKQVSFFLVILVAVFGAAKFAMSTAKSGFVQTSEKLVSAQKFRQKANDLAALVNLQAEATRSMLISPETMSEVGEEKLKAFDKQMLLLESLKSENQDAKIESLSKNIKDFDQNVLKPLEESILELLLGGESEKAKAIFFDKFGPERAKYNLKIEELKTRVNEIAERSLANLEVEIDKTISLIGYSFLMIGLILCFVFVLNLKKRECDRKAQEQLARLLLLSQNLAGAQNFEQIINCLHKNLSSALSVAEMKNASFSVAFPNHWSQWKFENGTVVGPYECVELKNNGLSIEDGKLILPCIMNDKLVAQFEWSNCGVKKVTVELNNFMNSAGLSLGLAVRQLINLQKMDDDRRVIEEKQDEMKLILDSIDEGLVTVSLEGTCIGTSSLTFDNWFGPSEGQKIWDVLYEINEKEKCFFAMMYDQMAQDILPFDTNSSQMPQRIFKDDRVLEIHYREVFRDGKMVEILVAIQDITEREIARIKELEGNQIVTFMKKCQTDRIGITNCVREINSLCDQLETETRISVLKRIIHTIKGTSASFGLTAFSSICHTVESEIVDLLEIPDEKRLSIVLAWKKLMSKCSVFLDRISDTAIFLQRTEIQNVVNVMRKGSISDNIINKIDIWLMDHVSVRFGEFEKQIQFLAKKLHKQVSVSIESNGVCLPPELFAGFFSSFIHVIRNMIDHGIELPEVRLGIGKDTVGHIKIICKAQKNEVVIAISDDGSGINWGAIEAKAKANSLPFATQEDLIQALFADGISTNETVSEISGRGVGLAAVLEHCSAIGGKIEVTSQVGKGTSFQFNFSKILFLIQEENEYAHNKSAS